MSTSAVGKKFLSRCQFSRFGVEKDYVFICVIIAKTKFRIIRIAYFQVVPTSNLPSYTSLFHNLSFQYYLYEALNAEKSEAENSLIRSM